MNQVRPPCVTVVIPCHNYAEYLPEAVCSVASQSYRDWELIVVDDGSEDDSVRVTEALIGELPHVRISLITQPNGGVSCARNTGISAARGRYILPLDADDVLAETMLEKAVDLLESDPTVDVAFTDVYVFGEQVPPYVRIFPEFDFDLLRDDQTLFYCSVFRREVWDEVGGFSTDLTAYEDWDFWLNVAKRGYRPRRIAQPLVGVRHKSAGLHNEGLRNDRELRARITLRHPELFNEVTREWAEAILAPTTERDERIPNEILSRAAGVGFISDALWTMNDEVLRLRMELEHCQQNGAATPSHARSPWPFSRRRQSDARPSD